MTSTTRSLEASRGRGTGWVWAALGRAAGWPGRVYRARQLMQRLGRMSEHELRDIGLTPQDLGDAGAVLFEGDPSVVLRRRVEERRRRR